MPLPTEPAAPLPGLAGCVVIVAGVLAAGGVVVLPGAAAPAPAAAPVTGTVGIVGIMEAVGLDEVVDADDPPTDVFVVVGTVEPIGGLPPNLVSLLLPGGSRSGPTQLARKTAAAVSVGRAADHSLRPRSLRSAAFLGWFPTRSSRPLPFRLVT